MPHLFLEYSSNVEEYDFKSLFIDIHQLLAQQLPTELASCKSRAVKYEQSVVGDGKAENAFVHLTIKVMPGRSQELLQAVATQILEKLLKAFEKSIEKLQLQISVDFEDLSSGYLKWQA